MREFYLEKERSLFDEHINQYFNWNLKLRYRSYWEKSLYESKYSRKSEDNEMDWKEINSKNDINDLLKTFGENKWYSDYEPEKYNCISVNDDLIEELIIKYNEKLMAMKTYFQVTTQMGNGVDYYVRIHKIAKNNVLWNLSCL